MPPMPPMTRSRDDHTAVSITPPLHRGSIVPRPWLGFWRSVIAWLAGLRFDAQAGDPLRPWQRAARARRRLLMVLVLALAGGAFHLSGGLTSLQGSPTGVAFWAQLAKTGLFVLLFAWVGVGFATALMGAWAQLRGDPHALSLPPSTTPLSARARTAVVMPICNEDVATVFGGLRATCESLAATGTLRLFDVFVLSDTADPAARAAEARAFEQLRATLGSAASGGGGGLYIRWRRRRTHRKAGNVADFCRRWGRDYRYMVVLDADSTMQGDTLVSLVRMMEAHPRVGILQTLPQAVGHDTLHARSQQFASRVTGRLFALGMAWWQLGESHYWGHNAILRVEPFMRHCGLAPLPGRGGLSGGILSHDFVEAALMRRAGWEVWLAPSLQGSWEQHPAHLLEELQRDRRWCQGNLQNARLIAEPGWAAAHRFMFLTGALSYLVAPLWIVFVALGLWSASGASSAPTPMPAGLWGLTLLLLLLPRALGVLAVQLGGRSAGFGGARRLWAGAALEAVVSAALAPLRMLAHAIFVTVALTGLRLQWRSPARTSDALPWRDALLRLGLPAAAAFALLSATLAVLVTRKNGGAGWLAAQDSIGPLLPVALPWLLAAPLAVWGSRRLRAGWLEVPEERTVPHALRRAAERQDFERLAQPDGLTRPPTPARPVRQARPGLLAPGPQLPWVRSRWAGGVVASAVVLGVVLPRPADTPGPAFSAQQVAVWSAEPLRQEEARLRSAQALRASDLAEPPLRLLASPRPARFIDDATRQRAIDFVTLQSAIATLDG